MLYLIGGPAKSGKSILRKKILDDKKISGISTDYLRGMFKNNKKYKISYKKLPQENSKIFSPFLINLIEEIILYSDEDFVIEGDLIDKNIYKKFAKNKNIKFIFLGYLNENLDQKISKTLKIEKNKKSWVNDFPLEETKKIINNGIMLSKELNMFCKKNNIPFFNTSSNFNKKITLILDLIKK